MQFAHAMISGALLLLAAGSTSAVVESRVAGDVMPTIALSTFDGNSEGLAVDQTVFTGVLNSGESDSQVSTLNDTFGGTFTGTADFDIQYYVLIGSGTMNFTVTDCCILGDTMATIGVLISGSGARTTLFGVETSPASIATSGPYSTFGLMIALTGYTDAPGGFPAGYDFTVSA
ncbi:MAG: hypothetical protein AAF628_09665 [Planctomycetota bacterium]